MWPFCHFDIDQCAHAHDHYRTFVSLCKYERLAMDSYDRFLDAVRTERLGLVGPMTKLFDVFLAILGSFNAAAGLLVAFYSIRAGRLEICPPSFPSPTTYRSNVNGVSLTKNPLFGTTHHLFFSSVIRSYRLVPGYIGSLVRTGALT